MFSKTSSNEQVLDIVQVLGVAIFIHPKAMNNKSVLEGDFWLGTGC